MTLGGVGVEELLIGTMPAVLPVTVRLASSLTALVDAYVVNNYG